MTDLIETVQDTEINDSLVELFEFVWIRLLQLFFDLIKSDKIQTLLSVSSTHEDVG